MQIPQLDKAVAAGTAESAVGQLDHAVDVAPVAS